MKRALTQWPVSMIVGLGSLAASKAFAYPIPPVPLRGLISQADLIAVVKVASIEGRVCERNSCSAGPSKSAASGKAPPTTADDVGKDPTVEAQRSAPSHAHGQGGGLDDYIAWLPVAMLHVEEAIKGPAKAGGVLRVRFEGNLICPAPPRYVAGESVLVFLQKEDRYGGWRTCSLSYGTKRVATREKRDAYVGAIRKMLEIERIDDAVERRRRTLDWIVNSIEDPHTYWDGVLDLELEFYPRRLRMIEIINKALAKQGDEQAKRWLARNPRPENPLAELTQDQRNRLHEVAERLGPNDFAGGLLGELLERVREP